MLSISAGPYLERLHCVKGDSHFRQHIPGLLPRAAGAIIADGYGFWQKGRGQGAALFEPHVAGDTGGGLRDSRQLQQPQASSRLAADNQGGLACGFRSVFCVHSPRELFLTGVQL